MPSNAADVPGNVSLSRVSGGTGQQRSERLRARRDEAGMAQVSGWVPKDRRAYAREVLAALAQGANHLPPDPEQAAALDAARADAAAARMAEAAACARLADAEDHAQALATKLEEVQEAGRQARAGVEAAQERERAAQEAAKALQGELAGIKSRRGWRGVLLRLANAGTRHRGSAT